MEDRPGCTGGLASPAGAVDPPSNWIAWGVEAATGVPTARVE